MTNKADLLKRIMIEPGKCGGRPTLRGGWYDANADCCRSDYRTQYDAGLR